MHTAMGMTSKLITHCTHTISSPTAESKRITDIIYERQLLSKIISYYIGDMRVKVEHKSSQRHYIT